ncbi:MAG: hypothetical protein LBS59_06550 [Puniceicoccales bacterium]|jgi:hypothetical protein|nr:hypothetical protein [Puniceicoccales bacterium]
MELRQRKRISAKIPFCLKPIITGLLISFALGAFGEVTRAFANGGVLPENLARRASASASSEHNKDYRAQFAIDGVVPKELDRADSGKSWCVRNDIARNRASFTLEWSSPVEVAEILYWGRTSFFVNECWRDFRVFAEDSPTPLIAGSLEARSGPQSIRLPNKTLLRRLRIEFDNAHGGPNPGAAEIMAFANLLTPAQTRAISIAHGFAPPTPVDGSALANEIGATKLALVKRRPLNPSHVYTYHVEGLSPGGGLFTYDLIAKKLTRLVDASRGVILDCQVSYDGSEILFSWKRTMRTPFEIWRIRTDGTDLKSVIADSSNNMNPCYLPDGGIAFMSDRKPAFAYCWTSTSPVLYRANADGSNVLRLSANYLTDFTPSVTADGRILYSRWEYVDRPAIPIQSLWAVNADGTNLTGIFGNRVLSPATFMEANEIPNETGKILCVMASHNGPCAGAIGLIDITHDANAQSSILNLTPDVRLPPVEDGIGGNGIKGPYESPFPLDNRRYLVSKAGTLQLRTFPSPLKTNSKTNTLPPPQTLLQPSRADIAARLGFYSPRPIRPRPRPRNTRPRNHPAPDAAPWADIIINDIHFGLGNAVAPNEIKRVAIIQEMEKDVLSDVSKRQFGFQFPVVSCGATYAPKRVWGFANVETDGSVRFLAPANIPIYFLPLDAQDRAVQRMRTFTHFMPNERQSCIGCHENRNYVAPDIKRNRSIAVSKPPQKLTPPSWGASNGFSFPKVVQPILDKHCTHCHSPAAHPATKNNAPPTQKRPAANLDLTGDRTDYFSVAYENLARRGTQAEHGNDVRGGMNRFGRNPYTSWIPTYNNLESNILDTAPKTWGSHQSRLADIVISRHPDKNGTPRISLNADERLRIMMWIDLNVPFYGTSQSLQPELRGCRKIMPPNLDATLREIAKRRNIKLRRDFYIRLDNPHLNPFLLEPLQRGDFKTTADPDYQRIFALFKDIPSNLAKRIDTDYRTVTQAAIGCPILPKPEF